MRNKSKRQKELEILQKLSIQELEEIVKSSKSFRDIARKLQISENLKMEIKLIVSSLNINYSHFSFAGDKVIGNKYNKLLVLGIEKINGRFFYKCLCDCGKECLKRSDNIRFDRVLSCGCACVEKGRFTRGKNNGFFKGCGDLTGTKIFDIKRNAKRKNIEYSVSKEYLWKLFEQQNKKCALSGQDLWFGRIHYPMETNASLDRIDSTKGYIEGNVQWVHKDVNKMKLNFKQEYFIELCKQIAANFASKFD